ncbi:hypothetical protein ACEXQE_15955 [Herbiconiux sp. P17]|uniref:hypothetical protein n=1 Tax=Herbiconiux wuyangfengii TaxID=3342794 RepID=UPI0035BA3B3B
MVCKQSHFHKSVAFLPIGEGRGRNGKVERPVRSNEGSTMTYHSPSHSAGRRFDGMIDRGVIWTQGQLRTFWSRLDPEIVATVVLGLLLVVSALVLWANVRTQWFIYDEFDYLMPPEGASWLGWLITPHNEHTIFFTKLWFSLLYGTIGLQGYWLYAVPMILGHLAGGVAAYKLVRLIIPSRAIAVATVAPLLLMAAGAGTLTWAGQFQYTAATAAGLWVLYLALSPTVGARTRWIGILALSLFGTFSGSAYIPLGVAGGLALIMVRRYLLGAVTILIPAAWFVLARVLYTIPSNNSAHSLEQVLRDGPAFIYALLNKAVNDSIPVSGSFTTPIMLAATIGAVAFLAIRLSGSPRGRRTYLFLLIALTLSLFITMIGRLSRDVADSASGGYSYFILIAAIPLFVTTIARFFGGTRIATTLIVLLLAGWGAIGIAGLQATAQGLADWKSSNATLLTGAAYLSQNDFTVASDAQPSPALAPTVSWSELEAMADDGRIIGEEPSQLTTDQISLNVQWVSEAPGGEVGSVCQVVAPHESAAVTVEAGDPIDLVATTAASTQVTLEYPTSDASRAIALPQGGLLLDSVADRAATVTTGDEAVTLCR